MKQIIKPVVTTHVRIFLRPGITPLPVESYLPQFYNHNSGSYHVPVHVRENPETPYVDIQYGSAGYPDTIQRVWDMHRDEFHSIWVRYQDESQDHDRIFWITSKGKSQDRACRYMFDHVRVNWLPGTVPEEGGSTAGDLDWVRHDELWGLNQQGSYLAENNRSVFCHGKERQIPGVNTATTSSCLCAGGMNWRYFKIEPEPLLPFVEQHHASFKKAEFYFNRRLVRADVVHPDEPRWGWTFFSLDDWDNCADPYYQKYVGYFFLHTKSM